MQGGPGPSGPEASWWARHTHSGAVPRVRTGRCASPVSPGFAARPCGVRVSLACSFSPQTPVSRRGCQAGHWRQGGVRRPGLGSCGLVGEKQRETVTHDRTLCPRPGARVKPRLEPPERLGLASGSLFSVQESLSPSSLLAPLTSPFRQPVHPVVVRSVRSCVSPCGFLCLSSCTRVTFHCVLETPRGATSILLPFPSGYPSS